MNAWGDDRMLALSDGNCKAQNDKRAASKATLDQAAYDLMGSNQPLKDFFQKHGLDTVCNYVNWASTEAISLSSSFKTDSSKTLAEM